MNGVDRPVLIRNARVYSFDDADSTADAILIEAGRVAAVGDGQALHARAGAPIETWNVRGATILPGLIDTHPHLLHFAVRQAPLVDIMTAVSHEDIVRRIADRAKSAPAGEWILTTPVGEPHYFIRRSYKDMEEGELPTRHVLDRATNQHPVAIQAWEPNIPNTAVFNSLALRELGITRDLPDRVGNQHREGRGRRADRQAARGNQRRLQRRGIRLPTLAEDPADDRFRIDARRDAACRCQPSRSGRHRHL